MLVSRTEKVIVFCKKKKRKGNRFIDKDRWKDIQVISESPNTKKSNHSKTRALLKTWELVVTKNGPTQSNILLDTKKVNHK